VVVTSYFLLYRFFVLVPVTTLVLAIVVLKRPKASLWWPTAAVVCGLLAGFLIDAWTTEAFFAPIHTLIAQIG
jgi:hypothetical protein